MFNLFTLFLVAIGLSMDTFSLSIVYGTIGLTKKKIWLLSIIVGLFHFVMPFLGNLIGSIVLSKLPFNPAIVVGIIFILIALEMFVGDDEVMPLDKIGAFLIFGFSVSLDSFSVGLGISMITNYPLLGYFIFSLVSFLFTYIGLKFGKFLNDKFGKYAVFLGAVILITLGLFYIF